MEFKTVSFNMKRTLLPHVKNHWLRRAGAIGAFFKAVDPDIVGTQELLISYIRRAETLLPDYGWVGEGRNGGESGEYTAIFYKKSRLRLVDWGVFWLSRNPQKPGSRSWFSMFPRTCTWAVFESVIDGSRVRVYNTHLDHVSFFARRNGLRVIAEHISANRKECENVILMGDFNVSPKSRVIRSLRDSSFECDLPLSDSCFSITDYTNGMGRTYHGFRGKIMGKPIDYIFTSDSLDVLDGYVDRQTYMDRYPSDHYPVVMLLKTKPT